MSGLLLILEALILTLFLHVLETLTLLRKSLDFLLLLNLLEALGFLHSHELSISLSQVSTHLRNLLLAHNLALLLALQVLFDLSLDELALQHLLFERLDEVEFEVLELLANILRICLLQLVLLLELSAHLLIVLGHLLLLNFFPVLGDVALDLLLALNLDLLGLLLVGDVAHEHFALQGLHHVLLLRHRLVRTLDLLPAQLVLVLLLLGVLLSSLDLRTHNDSN